MISDEILCAATGEYEQALLKVFPETSKYHHTFSSKFEKKMRHLCHKVKYKSAYAVFKRIACAIIAIILGGSMLLMLNSDARAAVIGWIKYAHNSFTGYFFAGENDEAAVPQAYDFEKLPEGYAFLDRMESDNGGTVLYAHENGWLLYLSYQFNTDTDALFLKPEEHVNIQQNVDGITMDIYISQNPEYTSTIVWKTDEKVLFAISANCDKDSLIQLARSVRPIK